MANPETCPQAFRGNQFPGNSNQAIPIIIPNRIPDGYLYTNMAGFSKKTVATILCFKFLTVIVVICVWVYYFRKSQRRFDDLHLDSNNRIDEDLKGLGFWASSFE